MGIFALDTHCCWLEINCGRWRWQDLRLAGGPMLSVQHATARPTPLILAGQRAEPGAPLPCRRTLHIKHRSVRPPETTTVAAYQDEAENAPGKQFMAIKRRLCLFAA